MSYQESAPPTKMPFGKHKDVPLPDLEASYIEWLLRDFEGLRPPLRSALKAELARRGAGSAGPGPAKPNGRGREPGEDDADASGWPPDEYGGSAEGSPVHTQAGVDKLEGKLDERIRKLARQEVSRILKRMAAALDKESQ